MVHDGLDAFAKTGDFLGGLKPHVERLQAQDDQSQSKNVIVLHRAIALLRAYEWRWQSVDKDIQYLQSEVEFCVPIINPETGRKSQKYELAGKIDKFVRYGDGRIGIREHKTSSDDISPTSDYWAIRRMDSQLSIYLIAAKELGMDISVIEYDVMRSPKTSPKMLTQGQTRQLVESGVYSFEVENDKGEKVGIDLPDWRVELKDIDDDQQPSEALVNCIPTEIKPGKQFFQLKETGQMFEDRLFYEMVHNHPYWFIRREIGRNANDVERARMDIWKQQQILRTREKGHIWEHVGSSCRVFGLCEYFKACSAQFDPDKDPLPEGYKKIEATNPELEENAE